ncbi:stalk domain-containing protein, partial [Paenibacillus sp.]|uniref:stalk domain-containing protein n=1 Tax=Paenibacillus sp. TaxID=58172 RepID=UPI0035C791C3
MASSSARRTATCSPSTSVPGKSYYASRPARSISARSGSSATCCSRRPRTRSTPSTCRRSCSASPVSSLRRFNGKRKQRFEPSPIMIDNRMFVPLRALFEAVGAAVEYDEATSG